MQDAQSNLTQAIQILMDFYAKAGQAVYLTQQSPLSEDWAIESLTTEIRWEGTNILSSLQVIQMVAPRDSSRKPQPTSPKRCAFLTSSLGKWWKVFGP